MKRHTGPTPMPLRHFDRRLGSGFDTVHAGRDQFFCSDPKYVAVDLQYGPDGAVYVIDWYDQQHCHNPNPERWDRSNGRIYRLEWAATYQPVKVDLAARSDAELVGLLTHRNAWYGRTAQRLLHERRVASSQNPRGRPLEAQAITQVLHLCKSDASPTDRLKALWAADAMGLWDQKLSEQALTDKDEYVRAWAVQLWTDGRHLPPTVAKRFARLAATDPSPVVRVYLASAIQRVPEETTAWNLIRALARHAEDRDDRNLPLLIWYGLAQRLAKHSGLSNALAVAESTRLPQLADFIYWYAATSANAPLDRIVAVLENGDEEARRRRLAGLWLALEPRKNVAMPEAWKRVAPKLYASGDARTRRQAERLAAVFGDDSMFPRLRETLASPAASAESRQHAFAVLTRAQDRPSLPIFLQLLDEAPFRGPTINLLVRFDDDRVSGALLDRFDRFTPADRALVLNALTSRASFALALLEAVSAGRIKRDQLTAFHIRQLSALHNAQVNQRVTATWGRIMQSPVEKQAQVEKLERIFNDAPLWAYDAGAGQRHFQKLCATCHRLGNEGARIGPELTGAGKNGIRYFLENIIDPDAVIGADFQMTTVETKSGDVQSGLVVNESASALTLRTISAELVIAKDDVAKRETSAKSLMPEGLLESMSQREQLELLKFLTAQ